MQMNMEIGTIQKVKWFYSHSAILGSLSIYNNFNLQVDVLNTKNSLKKSKSSRTCSIPSVWSRCQLTKMKLVTKAPIGLLEVTSILYVIEPVFQLELLIELIQ